MTAWLFSFPFFNILHCFPIYETKFPSKRFSALLHVFACIFPHGGSLRERSVVCFQGEEKNVGTHVEACLHAKNTLVLLFALG